MTDEDKKKYLKAAILSAISVAGVGAFVRNWKAKNDRKKKFDFAKNRDAIVIPVYEDKFMSDVQSPDEREKEMEGKVVEDSSPLGGFFDFFSKKSEHNRTDDTEGGEKKDVETPVNEKKVTEEKIDGRVVLRGQDGKFVSPTDPVAVKDIEKDAEMGFWDSVLHPVDFTKNLGQAFVDYPLAITGGALGSILLATKIVDYLNKKRKRNSENRVEDARDRYISLLEGSEGSEKKAGIDVPGVAGTVLGTAFFVPMALAAMVTNKIIENREAEKKKRASMADSYPHDPVFLYNVVGGEKIAMSADRALSLMMFKTAMVASCEEIDLEKSAQSGPHVPLFNPRGEESPFAYLLRKGFKAIRGHDDIDVKEAKKGILDVLSKNPKEFLDIIRARSEGDNERSSDLLRKLIMEKNKDFGEKLYESGYRTDPDMRNALENEIYGSPELTKLVANRFTDDKYKDTFGAYADELIGKKLGLRQGSFLHKILLWLMNAFGMRNELIKGEVDKRMKAIADPIIAERNDRDAAMKMRQTMDKNQKSPASWDAQTSNEPIPSNADYEELSYEDPQILIPGAGPNPNPISEPSPGDAKSPAQAPASAPAQAPAQATSPGPATARATAPVKAPGPATARATSPVKAPAASTTTATAPATNNNSEPAPGEKGWKNPALSGFQPLIDSPILNPFSFFKGLK